MKHNPIPQTMKGQTTMILIVLVVIIFGGLVLFLLSFAEVLVPSVEYDNLYVHNLLLTTLKTDTGYLDDDCRTISDLFMCSFTINTVCGDTGRTCREALDELLPYYLGRFEEVRPGFRYVVIAESGTPTWNPRNPDGTPMRMVLGNESLATEKVEKLSANQRIIKESYTLDVNILTARK